MSSSSEILLKFCTDNAFKLKELEDGLGEIHFNDLLVMYLSQWSHLSPTTELEGEALSDTTFIFHYLADCRIPSYLANPTAKITDFPGIKIEEFWKHQQLIYDIPISEMSLNHVLDTYKGLEWYVFSNYERGPYSEEEVIGLFKPLLGRILYLIGSPYGQTIRIMDMKEYVDEFKDEDDDEQEEQATKRPAPEMKPGEEEDDDDDDIRDSILGKVLFYKVKPQLIYELDSRIAWFLRTWYLKETLYSRIEIQPSLITKKIRDAIREEIKKAGKQLVVDHVFISWLDKLLIPPLTRSYKNVVKYCPPIPKPRDVMLQHDVRLEPIAMKPKYKTLEELMKEDKEPFRSIILDSFISFISKYRTTTKIITVLLRLDYPLKNEKLPPYFVTFDYWDKHYFLHLTEEDGGVAPNEVILGFNTLTDILIWLLRNKSNFMIGNEIFDLTDDYKFLIAALD